MAFPDQPGSLLSKLVPFRGPTVKELGICGVAVGAIAIALVAFQGPTSASRVIGPSASSQSEATVRLTPLPQADQDTVNAESIELAAIPDSQIQETPQNDRLDLVLRVDRGDTMVKLLTDVGIPVAEATSAVDALRSIFNPRRLQIGQIVTVTVAPGANDSETPQLLQLAMRPEAERDVSVKRADNGGFSADEILGRHVIGTIVPTTESGGRDLRRLIEDICSAPESYEQSVNENMLRNGDRVWIAWTNRIIRDAEGRLVEFLSIGTDITARRRAEEAQRASEARYRTLFEYAPDGILIADPESRYLDANPSICRMLGYARHELIGKLPVDILPPAELRRVAGTLSEIRDEGAHNQEWTFLRKDGSTFPADVIAAGTPDGNLIAVVRDVTERKAADAEREKRHRAEAADRIKSAFLATMSHELRTPLNSIIGFTGIMLQGLAGPVNPEQHKQLDMVRRSARHLLALVNDVLDISKIEAGQLDVAREPFDLGRSVAKVVASVAPQAEAKGLALVSEVAADLGTILGDERRVEQILLNLLGNAIKFTERGQVSVIAELADAPHPEAGGPVVRIRVADTGPGIRTEDLASLFQPFRQLDVGMARRHDGTGLGLAICRRLASLMGGDVVAESEWGVGSVFTVTLPLRSQESS